jgi:ribosomal protein S18 acetylase RimI-like enzyme
MPLGRVLEYLRSDSTSNLLAIYDLTKELSKTSILLAMDENRIRGYLLLYRGLSFPTAIIRGSARATDSLLEMVAGQKMVLSLDPPALAKAKENLVVTAVIPEDLMTVGRGEAKLLDTNSSMRLGVKDAEKLLDLYPNVAHTGKNKKRYQEWTERHVAYGVFQDGALVSVAGTWAEVDDGWVVGRVYTSPNYRGRGLATMATSAVTEQALRSSMRATLLVVSSNRLAIRVYEKLGYRKVGVRLWVDLGTGIRPLMTES